MKSIKFFLLMLIVASFTITSCGDDDSTPKNVAVTAITANGTSFADDTAVSKDLNGASSAMDVALNSTFTVTFDKEIDVVTAIGSNVQILENGSAVDAALSGTGSTITIIPTEDLKRGTFHTLNINNVAAADGGMFETVTRSFTTEGRAPVVVPNADAQRAYWNFDSNTDDENGEFSADKVIDLTYGEDRFGQGNSTASFDGNTTIVEVVDGSRLMESGSIAISFWMKINSIDHINQNGDPSGHFVFGLGAFQGFQFEIPADYTNCKLVASYELADGAGATEDLWFPGNGEDNMNGGWQGWDFVADLTGSGGVEGLIQDKWAHVICSYDKEERKGQLYINGELMKSQDFDLWPDGDLKREVQGVLYNGNPADVEDKLVFGFIKSADSPMWLDTDFGDYFKPTANHFKGDLDDFRIFDAPFSAADAAALYNAEKP
ncbi:MAG: hypothetical protein ACI9JY_000010 [Saprospiraceae bacterium]|jgi:hypothetical protein